MSLCIRSWLSSHTHQVLTSIREHNVAGSASRTVMSPVLALLHPDTPVTVFIIEAKTLFSVLSMHLLLSSPSLSRIVQDVRIAHSRCMRGFLGRFLAVLSTKETKNKCKALFRL